MDKMKQIDLIRKRNKELSKQLNDLKFKLEFDSQFNAEGYKQAKDLIQDLEKIKSEWLQALNDLQNAKLKYSFLIKNLQEIKKLMGDIGYKIPLRKRIIMKFKNCLDLIKLKF